MAVGWKKVALMGLLDNIGNVLIDARDAGITLRPSKALLFSYKSLLSLAAR